MKSDRLWRNPAKPKCTMCGQARIPLVQSGVLICPTDDGWPPILEPPAPTSRLSADPVTGHIQGCGAGKDTAKRCICPWNRPQG